MRGQPFSSDSDERWKSLVAVAERLGIEIKPELVVSLDRDMTSPELGYPVVQQLLATKQPFTAIVAFNDISAIGAIRALKDFNLRVPEDVSVIGFDDIKAAAFTSASSDHYQSTARGDWENRDAEPVEPHSQHSSAAR